MDRRQQILKFIKRRKEVSSADLVEVLGISRQQVAAYLRELVAEGHLDKTGSTRKARYTLATAGSKKPTPQKANREFQSLKKLEEDRIFDQLDLQLNLKKQLPSNVYSIVYYAFTEMVNNAIDHSKSKRMSVEAGLGEKNFQFVVRDYGIGVFENIKKTFKLESHFAAIELVTKGKQTTFPERHSGQGLFFTSKVADQFRLRSGKLEISFDNKIHDFFTHQKKPIKGTRVEFRINRRSRKKIAEVFAKYANDDFEFDKTLVRVRLSNYDNLLSRSQARRILLGLDEFDRIELDFSGVGGVGQAFADEIFRVYANRHPEKQFTYINDNEAVRFMIVRAKKGQ